MILTLWISENDALTSLIYNVLEEFLHVLSICAYFFWRHSHVGVLPSTKAVHLFERVETLRIQKILGNTYLVLHIDP